MSGERHKILVEVGLIVVATLVCDPYPIDWLCRVNRAKDVLKPDEAGQFFWGDANQPFELGAQVILTDSDTVTQPAD